MIALDPIVQMLSCDVPDGILRPLALIDFGDHLGIGRSIVRDDRQGLVETHRLPCLTQKRPSSLGIPSRRQAEVDQLAMLIDRAPKIAPSGHLPGCRFRPRAK